MHIAHSFLQSHPKSLITMHDIIIVPLYVNMYVGFKKRTTTTQSGNQFQ